MEEVLTQEQQEQEKARKLVKAKLKEYIKDSENIPSLEEFCLNNGLSKKLKDFEQAEWLEDELADLQLKKRIILENMRLKTKEGLEEELSKLETTDKNLMIVEISGVGIRQDIHKMIEEERARRKANKK